jgi:hypothetical protein
MSIETRIARLEALCRPDLVPQNGEAVRAVVLELLKPENAASVDALRAAAVAEADDSTLSHQEDLEVVVCS